MTMNRSVISLTFPHAWEMRVITIDEEEREIIVTYVSTSGLQKQSNKAEKGQINSQIIETSY